jgi:hypothetical protein
MDTSTENFSTRQLILFSPERLPVRLQVVNLTLAEQKGTVSEYRLTFQVDLQLYQQIDAEFLFNLKPELQGSLNAKSFHHETVIEIEAALQPQLLPQLAKQVTSPESAIDYLITCSQQNFKALLEASHETLETESSAKSSLLSTESWFALSVKQQLESGEIGYRTFWSYINPAMLTSEMIASGQFSAALEKFLKDRNEADLSRVGRAISEVFEEIASGFKDWDENEFLKQTEATISEMFAEVTEALENWADPIPTANPTTARSIGKIYRAMIKFFSEDDWAFAKLQGESTLKLAFQGKHGFIFYSICPLQILETRQASLLELIARVNSGLAMGNFEFNFTDRTVHFKTSIDVTGDRLTPALIKRLVYTNVLMMDQYLPGIEAVLAGETPEIVIRSIEQSE